MVGVHVAQKARFAASELIRIPAGFVLIVLAISAFRQGIPSFAEGPIGIVVGTISVVVGIVFLGIGGVMALGWIGELKRDSRPRRIKKSSKS